MHVFNTIGIRTVEVLRDPRRKEIHDRSSSSILSIKDGSVGPFFCRSSFSWEDHEGKSLFSRRGSLEGRLHGNTQTMLIQSTDKSLISGRSSHPNKTNRICQVLGGYLDSPRWINLTSSSYMVLSLGLRQPVLLPFLSVLTCCLLLEYMKLFITPNLFTYLFFLRKGNKKRKTE